LIRLDNYDEPLLPKDRNIVLGLRGGAAILMVASLESFLCSLPEIHMNTLINNYSTIDFSKLPKDMQITNVFKTLDRAMKNKFGAATKKIDRIIDIRRACRIILKDRINSNAFLLEGKNPRPDVISNCFKIIGKRKIFKKVTKEFQKKWGTKVPTQFIKDKLNEIVNRRNIVAHKSIASRITKNDLIESIKFLMIIAKLLDKIYKKQIYKIYSKAKIP
ncbi:unnamed protein product, partial [marine sediment metagenome]